jgi:hypothetical protein
MEVWYIARFRGVYGNPIERREFVRSTAKMLIGKAEDTHAKETTWSKAFLTWEDAQSFLIEKALIRVSVAEKELEKEQKALEMIQSLTNDEGS